MFSKASEPSLNTLGSLSGAEHDGTGSMGQNQGNDFTKQRRSAWPFYTFYFPFENLHIFIQWVKGGVYIQECAPVYK